LRGALDAAFFSPMRETIPSPSDRPSASFTSSVSASMGTMFSGSVTSAIATKTTPSRNSGASCLPSSTTRRVLPTPPGPTIVTIRCSRTSSASAARSAARPTSGVRDSGTLLGRLADSPFPSSAAGSGTTTPSADTA
jgi:hypothetical protein